MKVWVGIEGKVENSATGEDNIYVATAAMSDYEGDALMYEVGTLYLEPQI